MQYQQTGSPMPAGYGMQPQPGAQPTSMYASQQQRPQMQPQQQQQGESFFQSLSRTLLIKMTQTTWYVKCINPGSFEMVFNKWKGLHACFMRLERKKYQVCEGGCMECVQAKQSKETQHSTEAHVPEPCQNFGVMPLLLTNTDDGVSHSIPW